MFSIEQINSARTNEKGKVKFPEYVREIIKLGVTSYDTYVEDGHTVYHGKNSYQVVSEAIYENLSVNNQSDTDQFQHDLKDHQEGNKDYLSFCNDCAKSGVEKWVIDMASKTCTYFNKAGQKMYTEKIPTLQEDKQLQGTGGRYS
jgi:uncharacterized protein YbcV (DUF1398 family)